MRAPEGPQDNGVLRTGSQLHIYVGDRMSDRASRAVEERVVLKGGIVQACRRQERVLTPTVPQLWLPQI